LDIISEDYNIESVDIIGEDIKEILIFDKVDQNNMDIIVNNSIIIKDVENVNIENENIEDITVYVEEINNEQINSNKVFVEKELDLSAKNIHIEVDYLDMPKSEYDKINLEIKKEVTAIKADRGLVYINMREVQSNMNKLNYNDISGSIENNKKVNINIRLKDRVKYNKFIIQKDELQPSNKKTLTKLYIKNIKNKLGK
jgi:hypothetical protein